MLTASSAVAATVTTVKMISLVSGPVTPLMTPPRPFRGGRGATPNIDWLWSPDGHLRPTEQGTDEGGRPTRHLRGLQAHPRRDQLRQEVVLGRGVGDRAGRRSGRVRDGEIAGGVRRRQHTVLLCAVRRAVRGTVPQRAVRRLVGEGLAHLVRVVAARAAVLVELRGVLARLVLALVGDDLDGRVQARLVGAAAEDRPGRVDQLRHL